MGNMPPMQKGKRRVCALLAGLGLLVFTVGCSHAAPEGVKLEEVSTREGVQRMAFNAWLTDLKGEARKRGISEETLQAALGDVRLLPKVVEYDRKQPEKTITFASYLSRIVPASRVRKAKRMLEENRNLLDEVSKKYGVPASYIVALWGIESDFGNNTGKFHVPEALTTLAYEGRRAEFFRKELLDALTILQAGHITSEQMKGSWAGAMGQNQFMPSSFIKYAVDYDNNGHKDIWSSKYDVFASIANYLATEGWNATGNYAQKVLVPASMGAEFSNVDAPKPLSEWQAMGVLNVDKTPLTGAEQPLSLVMAEKNPAQSYLVNGNFRTIMKWNRSIYFSIAVGMLADAIQN